MIFGGFHWNPMANSSTKCNPLLANEVLLGDSGYHTIPNILGYASYKLLSTPHHPWETLSLL